MKPINLCLVQIGNKGIELVNSFPNVLPAEVTNQIVLKSMPFGAKHGDFITTNSGQLFLSGYVFKIPRENERDNLASIVAVYDSEKYNPPAIKKLFSITIEKLTENKLVNIETIEKILPEIYNGMSKGHLKIKISSIVTLEIDFITEEEEEEKESLTDPTEEIVSDVQRELWK